MQAQHRLADIVCQLNVEEREVYDVLRRCGRSSLRAVNEKLGYPEGTTVLPHVLRMVQIGLLREGSMCIEDMKPVKTWECLPAELGEGIDRMSMYSAMWNNWRQCSQCALASSRKNVVFARGNLRASVMLIGAAPTLAEDVSGLPFTSADGVRYLSVLKQHAGLVMQNSGNVCYTPMVCCVPQDDNDPVYTRNPRNEEYAACCPHVTGLLRIVNPKVVVLLGKVVSDAFFHMATHVTRFPYTYGGVLFLRIPDVPDTLRDVSSNAVRRDLRRVQTALDEVTEAKPTIVWNIPQIVKL